jgi:sulfonate transport system permease protein
VGADRMTVRAFVVPGALVLVWTAVAASHRVDPHLIVPLPTVAATLVHLVAGMEFWHALGASFARLLAGFALGAGGGIVAGVVLGVSRIAERVGAPTVHAGRQVALFAWIPLLTAWFGDGDLARILLVALAAFFPVALNTENGCRGVARELREVGRVLEFDRWATLRYIVLPAASRSIVTGLQLGLTTAWIGTIGAEYLINQGTGIGVALSGARLDNRMDVILVYMLALAVVGLVLNKIVQRKVVDD